MELVTKAFAPADVNFTPGERSAVSYITTDIVDNELDVVIATGVDYESVFKANPVVLSKHDLQSWPVGLCEWIKVIRATPQRRFNGLVAKTMFDEESDALRLFHLVQRGIVRGQSITFRPPEDFRPGEWGPPTKEELRARPEWESAKRVIRRCVLIEYSFVPIPMNQESLVMAVSKGLDCSRELPTYLREVPAVREARRKAMSGASGASGGFVEKPTAYNRDPDDDEYDDDTDSDTQTDADLDDDELQPGDCVEWGKGMSGGCGRIKSIHKAGKVPDVDEDIEGTEDEPAAKVRVYSKSVDDKWQPTSKMMGHRCKSLTRIPGALEPDDDDDDESELDAKPATKRLSHTPRISESAISLVRRARTVEQVEAHLLDVIRKRFDPVPIAERAARLALERTEGAI